MKTNKLNLRSVVAIAICLAAMTVFTSCEKEKPQVEESIVGKWFTSDFNSQHNDTIHFTANMRVEDYFMFSYTDINIYPDNSFYFTYFLTENTIKITSHHPEIDEFSETFEYLLHGDSLTLRGFSNPFSMTQEARSDVHFIRIE